MGTNCSPLAAHLFLIFYERYCMTSLIDHIQADIVEARSKYLDADNAYYRLYFCTSLAKGLYTWSKIKHLSRHRENLAMKISTT